MLPDGPDRAADELADGNDFDGSTMPVDGVSSVIEGAIANELLPSKYEQPQFLALDHCAWLLTKSVSLAVHP